MRKIRVKNKIVGFVYQTIDKKYHYAFGKPSQTSYIAFDCDNEDQGKQRIIEATNA